MRREESTRKAFASSDLALLGVVVIIAAVAFAQSYGRWLDPIIDAGRDLYIPEQLRGGATLYKDILYYYPPVTPYLLAAITALIGSSLHTYIAIGAVTSLLTAVVLWLIVRPLAGPYAATCTLGIFFAYCMCGVGGWGSNYFFPYAHAALLAMLFFLAAIALFLRHRIGPAMVLLLAASCTKIEYAFFSAIVVVFMVTTRRMRWQWLVGYLVALASIVMAAAAFFGMDALRANVLPPTLLGGDSARRFYAQVTGMSSWGENLLRALRGAALIALFVGLLRAWDLRPRARVLIAVALAVATVLLANDAFFRAWALLQLALVPFALRVRREPLALLLLASLCASSRIYLNLTPAWYGFVFILPVLALVTYVLFEWLPERGVYTRRAAIAWLPLTVLLCARGLLEANRAYAEAVSVETKRGTYYDVSPRRAAEVSALLRHLGRVGARELVVMPEGLAINYLSRVPTPLRYQTFTPVEIAGEERTIVSELERHHPQYVALVPRDVREFGYRQFGLDYGREIMQWLGENYEIEERFGGIALLRTRHPLTRPSATLSPLPRGEGQIWPSPRVRGEGARSVDEGRVTRPGETRRPDSPSARTPAPSRR